MAWGRSVTHANYLIFVVLVVAVVQESAVGIKAAREQNEAAAASDLQGVSSAGKEGFLLLVALAPLLEACKARQGTVLTVPGLAKPGADAMIDAGNAAGERTRTSSSCCIPAVCTSVCKKKYRVGK